MVLEKNENYVLCAALTVVVGVAGRGLDAVESIYLSIHCRHQNDFCIKMGSDESHFNVSVGSDGQSHKCPQTTTFLKRKENRSGIEPRSFRLPA